MSASVLLFRVSPGECIVSYFVDEDSHGCYSRTMHKDRQKEASSLFFARLLLLGNFQERELFAGCQERELFAGYHSESHRRSQNIMNTYFLACFLLLLTHAASECSLSTEFTSSVVVVKFLGCPLGLTSHLDLLASKFKETYNSRNKGPSSNTNTCDPVFREVTLVTASLPTNFELDFDGSSDEAESDFECPGKFEVRFDITVGCQGCDLNPVTLFDEDNDAGGRHLVLRKLQLRHDTRQLQNDCTCDINLEYRAVTEEEMVDAYNRALDQLSGLPSLSVEDVIEIKQVQCDSVKSNFTTTIDLIFDTDSPDETVSAEILITLSDNLLRSYNDLAERFCDPNFRKVQTVEVDKSTVTPGTRRELLTFTTNSVLNVQLSLEGSCRGCGNDSGLFVSK